MSNNFKIRALTDYPHIMEKGKIYEFKEGVTTWENGFSSYTYKDFKDFITHNAVFSEKVELVDNEITITLNKDDARVIRDFLGLTSLEDAKSILKANGYTSDFKAENADNKLYVLYHLLDEKLKGERYKMDILLMLQAQADLDEFTLKRAGVEGYPKENIELALRVELGELVQEWKGFKYWKKSKGDVDRAKLLEEWADCMHFALSLENNRCRNEQESHDTITEDYEGITVLESLNRAFETLTLLDIVWLGLDLGFTEKELEDAYYNKNTKNWERMRGNY